MTQIIHSHHRLCLVLLGFVSLALCIASYAQAAAAPDGSSQRCNTNDDCSPASTFQTCFGGFCKCKSVSHFDPSIKSCRIHVGGTCDMFRRPYNEPCVENASCDSTVKLAAKGSCMCNAGYEENYLGFCIGPKNGVESSQIGTSFNLLFVASGAVIVLIRRL